MVHKSTFFVAGVPGEGTVTEVDTGTGLTGGPITSSGSIAIADSTDDSLAGYNHTGVFSTVLVGSGLSLSSGTLTASAGAPTFDTIGSGTNTTAAMVVGSGGTLGTSGSGAITATALPVGGITGLGTGVATFLATPTSANLAAAVATTTTGSGSLVLNTSPTFVTPILGTPTSGVATNLTGTASGLTAGAATVLATARAIGGVNFDGSAAITPQQLSAASESSDNTNFPLFLNSASSSAQQPKYNTSFEYNASTNALTATTFVGALTGNADTVTTNANLTGPITSTGNAVTTLTAHNVLLGNGTGAIAYAPPVSAGYVLTDNGTGSNPTFQAASGGGITALTGDVTASGTGSVAATVAKIAGVAVGTPTGTTNVVFSNSPTLVTPTLGVASATSLATSAASPLLLTNGQLATIALTSQTVGATTLTIPDFASVADEFTFKTKSQTMSNKTFVAPALGTPASGVLTNCSGTASSLTAGTVTTNANMTGDVTSSGSNATTVAAIAGVAVGTPTGNTNVVFSNGPTLVTPTLGAASATSVKLANGGALQTDTTSGHTALLAAYNTGGSSYTTFATLTAGATPTMDLSNSVTINGGKQIVESNATGVSGGVVITNIVACSAATYAGLTPNSSTLYFING